ncbi:MAG: hypothetical protein ACREDT_05705 [Methylocella sp.]
MPGDELSLVLLAAPPPMTPAAKMAASPLPLTVAAGFLGQARRDS